MTIIVSICMALVIGFCCGRLSALENTEVKRLSHLYQDKSKECDDIRIAFEQAESELASVKRKLSGIGNALNKLSN